MSDSSGAQTPSKPRLLQRLGPLAGALLFALALGILHHQLQAHDYREILDSVRQVPFHRVAIAALLTALSYGFLVLYDAIALRYIGRALPFRVIALGGFVGCAFSNNGGFPIVTGGSVRYRLYSAWNLTALDIGKIMVFNTTTFWLGFFCLGAFSFLLEPMPLPSVLDLPFKTTQPLGWIGVAALAVYLLACLVRRGPIKVKSVEFRFPTIGIALSQMAVAAIDLLLVAGVFFVLVPSDTSITYPAFLGFFAVALVAGVMSQVPGGLGVFETVLLLLLKPYMGATATVATLLTYRAVYYFLPLTVAAGVMGVCEVYRKRRLITEVGRLIAPWAPLVAPHVLAFTTFFGGVILLASGATPPIARRFALLREVVPLPVIETSHFLGSLAGAGLLLLARGLQQRFDAAYYLASCLLAGGIVFSLTKGLDYEEAIVFSIMLIALLPCRPYFYRRASLLRPRLTPPWVAAIAVVIGGTAWLLLFAHKHVEYRHELWWQFALDSHVSRSMRAGVGIAVTMTFFGLARLLRPAPPEPVFPGPEELEQALVVIKRSPDASANLALLADKMLLFNESKTAFVMYGVDGRSWVALGDPVGPESEKAELVWRFRELCERHGAWSVFYEVDQSRLSLYLDAGLTLLKLGEEARVPLESFSLEGSGRKEFRHVVRSIEREGGGFEIATADTTAELLPQLRAVSDEWLEKKRTREKRFSLGSFREDYLRRFPCALVRQEGRIVAFANLWSTDLKEEISVDLMRHTGDAPSGVMDYLFVNLMLWGREQGYKHFNLGMAPLAGLESHELAPLWNRLGSLVFRHGEHFYNFRGLRQYKEKFDPIWCAKYFAVPGGLVVPRALANTAALISGGLTGVVRR